MPFRTQGGDRIDDTLVHKAIREALANCLINTDYYGTRGVVIKKETDRTVLLLEFKKKQAKKTSDNIEKIRKFLEENGESKTSDIAGYLALSPARTRVILNSMDNVEAIGGNSNRRYKLR